MARNRTLNHLLSQLYGVAVWSRTALHRHGVLRSRALRHPVISVGNLTTGGTGKTPFVAHLTQMLKGAGYQPVILSRGYRGKAEGTTLLVSDGKRILCEPESCGDEAYWLASKLKGVPVVVGKNRYRGGRLIEDQYEKVIYVLDDGYQHLQLKRDLNILILDATDPLPSAYLLPKGRLREPLSAIERADLIVITRSHLSFDQDEMEVVIRKRNRTVPISYFYHDATSLSDLKNGNTFTLRSFLGKNVIALAAIGNPALFLRDLAHYQIRVLDQFFFRDHHPFNQLQLDGILGHLSQLNAEAIVTTEKDAVRLKSLKFEQGQIFSLRIEAKAEDPEEYCKYLLNEVEAFPALRRSEPGR